MHYLGFRLAVFKCTLHQHHIWCYNFINFNGMQFSFFESFDFQSSPDSINSIHILALNRGSNTIPGF